MNFLHSKIVFYLTKELGINLFEHFRITVDDNSKGFFALKKPDYSICVKCGNTFLPLFVSEIKKKSSNDKPKDQLIYSSPLPSPYLNFRKIYSTVVGPKANVYVDDYNNELYTQCEYDLDTLTGILGYIKYIAMYIKDNYNKSQEVKMIRTQKQSYTIICRDYVYKLCDFISEDDAIYFQKHLSEYSRNKKFLLTHVISCETTHEGVPETPIAASETVALKTVETIASETVTPKTVETIASEVSTAVSTGIQVTHGAKIFFFSFLTPYIPGKNIENTKSNSYQPARDILAQLCHLHTNGFTHNDVRPPNIIYGTDERTRLIDFEYVLSKGYLLLYPKSSNIALSRLDKLKTFQFQYLKLNSNLKERFLVDPHFLFAWLCLKDIFALCNCFNFNTYYGNILDDSKITDEASTYKVYYALINIIFDVINPKEAKNA